MSILLDRDTKVIVQGITGRMARFHTKDMLDYGTNVVGGVVPGKSGEKVEGVPVFDTVKEAVAATGAEASITRPGEIALVLTERRLALLPAGGLRVEVLGEPVLAALGLGHLAVAAGELVPGHVFFLDGVEAEVVPLAVAQ